MPKSNFVQHDERRDVVLMGEIFKYLKYLFCLFVEDDGRKAMVGGGSWRGSLPNLRVRPSGGEKTPEKYYCP